MRPVGDLPFDCTNGHRVGYRTSGSRDNIRGGSRPGRHCVHQRHVAVDFRAACKLEFTNRHGSAYRGMTEADENEIESGWSHNHPWQSGAPGPPELRQIKHLFGLTPSVVQSTELSGHSATVVLRNPRNGAHRHVRLRLEGNRWLVYEVELGELISP